MRLPVPWRILKTVHILISRIIYVADTWNLVFRQLCCIVIKAKEVGTSFDLGLFAIGEIGQTRTVES